MSLAFKLWKIGRVLSEDDVWSVMSGSEESDKENDIQYANINILMSGYEINGIELKEDSIGRERLFFTKKIGGTSNAYYLYPNLNLQKSLIKNKVQLLVNTLKYGMLQYVGEKNLKTVEAVLSELEDLKSHIRRAEAEKELSDLKKSLEKLKEEALRSNNDTDYKKIEKVEKDIVRAEEKLTTLIASTDNWNSMLLNLCSKIVSLPEGNYWLWLSINGQTLYELMPEIRQNWFAEPVSANVTEKGFDAFTNKEAEIGYKPDIKVFSYDQYHDSMNYRLNLNLPLSLESARNIKFAWIYLTGKLQFYFKGLEYIIIPNILSDDQELYRTVLRRFKKANTKSGERRSLLERHTGNEKKLEKDIEKLRKKKAKADRDKLDALEQKRKTLSDTINRLDTGLFRELDEQIEEIGDLKHTITVDYIFTEIDRTNESFQIKGSIEDVIPGRIQQIVKEMRREGEKINDRVKPGLRSSDETLLQDYFNRKELFHVLSRSQKNNANSILQEKLYLAKLLLTDMKIDLDSLMARFEENRLYGYDMKKRVNKEGIYQWMEYTSVFTKHDETILNFLRRLGKIKTTDHTVSIPGHNEP